MDKKELLNILYLERDRLYQKYNVPGWNLWATIAGIATTIWTFVLTLEQNEFSPTEVIRYFLFIILLYYIVRLLHSLTSKSGKSTLRSNRFTYFSNGSQSGAILMHILIFLFIVYIHDYFNYLNDAFFTFFKYSVLIVSVLLFSSIILKHTDLPVPMEQRSIKWVWLIMAIFCFMLGIIEYGLFLTIRESHFSFASLKFGILLFGFYYLLLLLLKLLRPNQLLFKIDDLIDNALFDRKDTKEILGELEVLILGLELKSVFEKPLARYFGALEKHNEQNTHVLRLAGQIEEELQILLEMKKAKADKAKIINQAHKLKDLTRLIELYLDESSKTIEEIDGSIKPLSRLFAIMKPIGISGIELIPIAKQIKGGITNVKEKYIIIREKVRQVKEKSKELDEF